jgi:hypothetical protein
VRDRRTRLVQVLVAVLAATVTGACDLGPSADIEPSPGPTLVAVDPVGGDPPELTEALEVELGTAVAVFGRGCRAQSPHQRCSADGTKTYSLKGGLQTVTAAGVWMQLDTGRPQWTVRVRFGSGDEAVVGRVAARTEAAGGFVVVLDAHSGDVLQAVAPTVVRNGRIVVPGLPRPGAEHVVNTYVTAATGR